MRSLGRRRSEAAEVARIGDATLALLEEIRDNADDQDRVNRAIARVDGLRAKMNELGATYDLVAQLNQRAQLSRFEADRRISSAKMDGVERQRRQVARDIDNVRGMVEAARRFQTLMDEVISRLSGVHGLMTARFLTTARTPARPWRRQTAPDARRPCRATPGADCSWAS